MTGSLVDARVEGLGFELPAWRRGAACAGTAMPLKYLCSTFPALCGPALSGAPGELCCAAACLAAPDTAAEAGA